MKLIPKTKTARDKINKDGNEYILVEVRSGVSCLNGETGLLIRSIKTNTERWIRQKNDENFDIEWD